MRKKILAIILMATMALSFAGCGKSTEGAKASKEPTDLTGTWATKDKDGSYQEAIITEDTIEINWVSEDSKSLYWAGTFTAPEKAVEEYKWTSENDKEKTGSAMLASADETKDFSYKDGVISYEASAMGTTTTMKMERK